MWDAETGSKNNFGQLPKPKREKGPTRILIPSLAEFKDLEEDEPKPIGTRRQPCQELSDLLDKLPPPRGSIQAQNLRLRIDEIHSKMNFEQLPKREKGPIRILIPPQAEFKDLEEDEPKPIRTRRQPCQKPSGLLGILPPLRGSIHAQNLRLKITRNSG